LARALGLEGHPVIGFIGSFYAYEGLALLLRAMPRMLAAAARPAPAAGRRRPITDCP